MAWVIKFNVPFLKFHFVHDTLTVLLTVVTPGQLRTEDNKNDGNCGETM